MIKSILRRVEKVVAERLPLEQWKQRAVEVGGQGLQTAMEIAERIQTRLKDAPEEPVKAVVETLQEQKTSPAASAPVVQTEELREQMNATAARVLEEARAVEQRIKKARPARRPLQVTVEVDSSAVRTKGRKTAPSTVAAKRVTAPSGFKAKRGQKHSH